MNRFFFAITAFSVVVVAAAACHHQEDECAGAGDCINGVMRISVDAQQAATLTVSGPACDGASLQCYPNENGDDGCTVVLKATGTCQLRVVTAAGATIEKDVQVVHVESCCSGFSAPDVDLRADAGPLGSTPSPSRSSESLYRRRFEAGA